MDPMGLCLVVVIDFLVSLICLCECPCDAVEKQNLEDFVEGPKLHPLQTCEILTVRCSTKNNIF